MRTAAYDCTCREDRLHCLPAYYHLLHHEHDRVCAVLSTLRDGRIHPHKTLQLSAPVWRAASAGTKQLRSLLTARWKLPWTRNSKLCVTRSDATLGLGIGTCIASDRIHAMQVRAEEYQTSMAAVKVDEALRIKGS